MILKRRNGDVIAEVGDLCGERFGNLEQRMSNLEAGGKNAELEVAFEMITELRERVSKLEDIIVKHNTKIETHKHTTDSICEQDAFDCVLHSQTQEGE